MTRRHRSAAPAPAYSVGIDLGTTHTVVAWAAVATRAAGEPIRLFDIEQLVGPGAVAARPLLPSLRYHPAPGELAAGATTLPWPAAAGDDGAVIGQLARQLGAQVPGRLVASAKSWLSHAAVDRQAAILPWGSAAEVPKVSPVAASASYLGHVRAAWNHRHPEHPLERQELVLTVPASFDDVARALTLEAARSAGLPTLRLLEEPQAALYDWLFRHRQTLAADLADTRLVLVCDVGGGTTDLSLVRVVQERPQADDLRHPPPEGDEETSGGRAFPQKAGEPRLERFAVGRHLMLGGDNMDLALAHRAEAKLAALPGASDAARLSPGHWSQLVDRCRVAKEQLLADDAPAQASVTLLGGGARLIGGARSVVLTREEVVQIVVDGFFPPGAADELPRRERASGLVAFGLPYASDAAVTRHIAAFLHQHRDAGRPDALLLNGGVFRAPAIARRLADTLAAWRGAPLRELHNSDPDVAVARGAVAHALACRGLGPSIAGGSPRSYFLRLDDTLPGLTAPGICLLPHGSEAGHELRLDGRSFALRLGEPVRFHLVATTADAAGRAPPRAGDLIDLAGLDAQALPPLATVVRAAEAPARELPVHLAAMLTELGTLEVHCIADHDPAQRWQLEFQLRDAPAGSTGDAAALPATFSEALACIRRVFGARDREVGPKAVKQLRLQLEGLLGNRERWPVAWLRPLFDALWQGARGRRRSADHERVWLSLAGWCLRPGFGDALDTWRIEQLWPLFEQGVQHGHDAQVNTEWWTLWRRVAGGLDETAQGRLLEDFAFNLRGAEAGLRERPPHLVKGGWDDMVRLGASLERIPAEHKAEVGDWLVERLRPAGAAAKRRAAEPWTPWALGRIGARVPLYGSAHGVVPAETACAWLDVLLALDWKHVDGAAAAAAHLARRSGDRARDLPDEACARVIARLEAAQMPAGWTARVRDVVPLDEAAQRSVFGEALPPGLTLIE